MKKLFQNEFETVAACYTNSLILSQIFLFLSACFFVNKQICDCFSKGYSRSPNVSYEQRKLLEQKKNSSLSGWLVILIFIFNADQQISFPLSFLYCYISGKIEATSSGSPPSGSSPPSSSSLEWYYIGGPLAAVVFLLALISYIKKRRETGKILIRQCFGARRSYFKQVIFCISNTDFEVPSTITAKPITNQITKTL